MAPKNGGNNNNRKRGNGNGSGGKQRKRNGRTRGIPGITQNVSVSVNNAFGDNAKPQTVIKGLDAFDPSHVPLPRAVGDYTVIRTTEIVSADNQFNLYGPMRAAAGGAETWSKTCSLHSVGQPNYPINASNGTLRHTFTALGASSWSDARVVPSAYTVRIMNPEALQTTSGMVYIGRARQMLNPGGTARTWEALAQDLVSYSSPELCAAGKLALRGVQVDAVPYDMNALSDFRMLDNKSAGQFTWGADDLDHFDGFAPIFVYNPNAVNLQVMICCEWRVRFDPSNPAYASHTYHKPSTLGYWDRVQRVGSALGNGVMDMAEKSASKFIMNAASTALRKAPLLLM